MKGRKKEDEQQMQSLEVSWKDRDSDSSAFHLIFICTLS